jgi:tRNA-dihydrouridine synthase B
MNAAEKIQLAIKGKAILAPMLTTTDIPFRKVCRSFDAALTMTEMVSAKGIIENSSASYRYAVIDPDERPVAIQIISSSAENTRRAIHELLPHEPDLFDINAGCPSERVCDAGAGAELLDDIDKLGDIVSSAVKASNIPVSVKVRVNGIKQRNSLESIVKTVEDSGATFITVHGRGSRVRYDEHADWDSIGAAKRHVGLPVVGNGDVFSSADAASMMAGTGCDAVMVARGSLGTPWIFRDIAMGRSDSIEANAPDARELAPVVLNHMKALSREFGPINALPRMRKHFLWYIRWYKGFEEIRNKLFFKDDAQFITDLIEQFFDSNPQRNDSSSWEFQEVEKRFHKRVLFWTIPAVPEIQT